MNMERGKGTKRTGLRNIRGTATPVALGNIAVWRSVIMSPTKPTVGSFNVPDRISQITSYLLSLS
jgi:hypothetical protein